MIYFQLFWNFFIVGCFSFGGGYAMLPLINRQVTSQGWITTEQFVDIIAISGMLPGSIGTNVAAFVGFQTAGLAGALVATLGMVLPSFLLILIIGYYFKRFQKARIVEQAFYGLRPVIVGLIFYSAIKFALSKEIVTTISWQSISFLVLFAGSLFLLINKKANPIMVMFLSALGGILFFI